MELSPGICRGEVKGGFGTKSKGLEVKHGKGRSEGTDHELLCEE